MMARSHIDSLLVAVALLSGGGVRPAHAADGPVANRFEAARQTTIRWMETRQAINTTLREWADQKEALELTRELLEKELGVLDGQIAKARDEAAGGETQRKELEQRLRERNGLLDLANGRLATVEQKLGGLTGAFPAVLLAKVESNLRRFPRGEKTAQIPVSQRLRNLLAVFNEIEQFNSQFTVTPEMREVDGRQVRVQVLYLGLAQAYYVNGDGSRGGFGHPTAEGWKWTARDGIAADVARAIRVFRDEAAPVLVQLPAYLKQP